MNGLFSVMIGGAIGSGARYFVGKAMLARLGPNFPWWTLSVPWCVDQGSIPDVPRDTMRVYRSIGTPTELPHSVQEPS